MKRKTAEQHPGWTLAEQDYKTKVNSVVKHTHWLTCASYLNRRITKTQLNEKENCKTTPRMNPRKAGLRDKSKSAVKHFVASENEIATPRARSRCGRVQAVPRSPWERGNGCTWPREVQEAGRVWLLGPKGHGRMIRFPQDLINGWRKRATRKTKGRGTSCLVQRQYSLQALPNLPFLSNSQPPSYILLLLSFPSVIRILPPTSPLSLSFSLSLFPHFLPQS